MFDRIKALFTNLTPSERKQFLEGIENDLKNPEVGDGMPDAGLVAKVDDTDGFELRHEPVYDQTRGTMSTKPVWRHRSEINIAIGLVLLFGMSTNIRAQLSCPAGTQVVTGASMRGSDDNIYSLECWDPVNKTLTFPNLTAGIIFSGPVTTGTLTPAATTDGFYLADEDRCQLTAATTAFTAGPAVVRAAANNLVLQGTTNTTGGTVTITCDLTPLLARSTANKGATVKSVDLYYGVQTTALTSIAAATVDSVTYPAAGGAASGTVAAIGGSLTVTPGALQLATTTSGQCYHENIAFGTTFAVNSTVQKLTLEQVLTTAGTTATVVQVCGVGLQFNYQN